MKVILMQNTDVSFVKELADESFGLNYITNEDILSYLNSKNQLAFCLYNKQEFVGFIFIKKFNNSNIHNYFLIEKKWFKDYFKSLNNIAVITQIALIKKHRQEGLSSILFSSSINYFKNTCDSIISICWVKDMVNPMKFLLQNNQFINLKTLNQYWLNDSIEKGYQCEICGTPCKCKAEVFELKKPI